MPVRLFRTIAASVPVNKGGWLRYLQEIVTVGIVCGVILVLHQALRPRPAFNRDRVQQVKRAIGHYPVLFAGKHLVAKGVDLSARQFTFFLFVSPDCVFCRQSLPFYKRLLSQAASRSVPMFVAIPNALDGQSFLASNGIRDAKVVFWQDLNMRVAGYPCIVLLDRDGMVLRVWYGQLDDTAQSSVIEAVRDPSRTDLPVRRLPSGEVMLTPDELRKMSVARHVTIIGVRERSSFKQDHAPGAINIPLQELAARAPTELRLSDLNVVDCSAEVDQVCSQALRILENEGFNAAALDRGGVVVRK